MSKKVKKISSKKTYTTGIGDDLGIIGPDLQSKDQLIMKPSLKS